MTEYYQLRHSAEKIDELLDKIEDGSVVIDNTSNVVSTGGVNPVSAVAVINYTAQSVNANDLRPVSGCAVAEAIADINTGASEMYLFSATLQKGKVVESATDKGSIASAIKKMYNDVPSGRIEKLPIYLRVWDTDSESDWMALASVKKVDADNKLTVQFEVITSPSAEMTNINTFVITAPYNSNVTSGDVNIEYYKDYGSLYKGYEPTRYTFEIYLHSNGDLAIDTATKIIATNIIKDLCKVISIEGGDLGDIPIYLKISVIGTGRFFMGLSSIKEVKDGILTVEFEVVIQRYEDEITVRHFTITAPFKDDVAYSEVNFSTYYDYGSLYKHDEDTPVDTVQLGVGRPVTSNAVAVMRDGIEHLSATLLSAGPGDTLDFSADLENDADKWLKIFNRAGSNKAIDVHLRLHKPVGNSPFYNGQYMVDVLVDSYKNEGPTAYLYAKVPFANGEERKLTIKIFTDNTRVLSVHCELESLGHLMTAADDSNISQLQSRVEGLSKSYIFAVGLNADGSLNYSGTYFDRIKNALFKAYSMAGLQSDMVSLRIVLDNYTSKTVSASYIQRTIVGASLIVKFDCPMDWTGKSDILRVTIQGIGISEDMADGDVFVNYEYVSVVNPDSIEQLKTTKPNVDIFMSGIEAVTDREFSISITHPLQEIFPDGRFVLMRRGGNRVRSTKRNSAYKGWVVAFPPQIPDAGYDGVFKTLPENRRGPYLLNSEYKGNTAPYDLLIDLLRYTAWFKRKDNSRTLPFWDFEDEYETEELMLNLSDNNIGYLGFNLGNGKMDDLTINGHRSTTIGIAFAVPNPAWNGTVGKRKDFEQAIDGNGNPRYFFSAPRQLCFSLRGLKRLYHLGTTTDAEVEYPSLRVMD